MAPRPSSSNRAALSSGVGDSWVVDSDCDSDVRGRQDSGSSDDSPPQTRRSSSRNQIPSSEQDFIMPSIHEGRVEGALRRSTRGTSTQPIHPNSPRTLRSRTGRQSRSPGRPRSQFDQTHTRTTNYIGRRKHRAEQDQISAVDKLFSTVEYALDWMGEIFGGALKFLTKPLSVILGVYLLAGLVLMLRNFLTQSVYTALSPLCRVPGASLLDLPMCQAGPPLYANASSGAMIEFDQLIKTQEKLLPILESATDEIGWHIEMKHVEMAVTDVRDYVEASQVLDSKEEMVVELDGFIDAAKLAVRGLTAFNINVGAGVDSVVYTLKVTQRELRRSEQIDGERGAIQRFFQDTLFTPFFPWKPKPNPIIREYIEQIKDLTSTVEELLAQAEIVSAYLETMESHVKQLNKVRNRDKANAELQNDDIMASLWTSFGFNRRWTKSYHRKLKVLETVGKYRETALRHVGSCIKNLQEMNLELEQLKQRMKIPGMPENETESSVTHHLEHIKMGIERIEASRRDSRLLEQDHHDQDWTSFVGRGDTEDKMRFIRGRGLPAKASSDYKRGEVPKNRKGFKGHGPLNC